MSSFESGPVTARSLEALVLIPCRVLLLFKRLLRERYHLVVLRHVDGGLPDIESQGEDVVGFVVVGRKKRGGSGHPVVNFSSAPAERRFEGQPKDHAPQRFPPTRLHPSLILHAVAERCHDAVPFAVGIVPLSKLGIGQDPSEMVLRCPAVLYDLTVDGGQRGVGQDLRQWGSLNDRLWQNEVFELSGCERL